MRHWPNGLDARSVLVAAGPWPAACRRGTQSLAGLRGAPRRQGPHGTAVPPPGSMCYSDQHRPRPRLTPAAARSSKLGSPWPPASRRAGRRSCGSPANRPAAAGPRGRGLDQHAVTASPQPAGLLHQRCRPPRNVCGGRSADGEHDLIRRPQWHRSSHTVLDPGPAAARSPAVRRND
jgi:hypothetical protein